MSDIINEIGQMGAEQIGDVLQAALDRYKELYPQWEVSLLSLSKAEDRNAQMENIIHMLEEMKNP
jgi:hypothetical protein